MIRKRILRAFIFLSIGLLSAMLQGCGLIETLGRAIGEGYLELCEPVFIVTKTEDTSDGICSAEDCSLRDAIVMANACEGEQTIQLSPLTYTLARDGAGEDDSNTGDLDIKDDLIIEGNNSFVDGGRLDRVFQIHGESTAVRMSSLTILNGYLHTSSRLSNDGAGIHNAGELILSNVTVRENDALYIGGGIYNEGDMEIINCDIVSNRSKWNAAGIHNDSQMTINGSQIAENYYLADTEDDFELGGMPAGIVNEGNLEITQSIIRDNNHERDRGVGIYNGSNPSGTPVLRLSEVTIYGHSLMAITSWLPGSRINIADSTIRDNPGGALSNELGEADLERVTISGNGASRPDYSHPSICSVIFNGGRMGLLNVTVSGNIGHGSLECATVRNRGGNLSVEHVTLYGNELPGIVSQPNGGAVITRIEGSILAHNSGQNCQGVTALSEGNNLLDDGTCSTFPIADIVVLASADLQILPLGDYGGLTLTHALLPGSPAIDAAGIDCPATDQRSVDRPQGDACDIGAYEAEFETVTEAILAATPEGTEVPSPSPTSTPSLTPQVAPTTPTPTFTLQPQPTTLTPTHTLKPSPPAAPAQLTILKKVCNDKEYSVTLGWMDIADNEDGYRVYRGKELIATLKVNATSYTDKPPGSGPYIYGVEAFNADGASGRPTVQEEGCLY